MSVDITTTRLSSFSALSTIADANDYFATRLYTQAWTTATIQNQQNALNDATRILNRLAWKGLPTCPGQEQSWPRYGLYIEMFPIDAHTIPQDILCAQYEIALALLKGYDPEREVRNASVKSRGWASARVMYDPELIPDHIRFGIPSLAAWNLMLPYLDLDIDNEIRTHRIS